MKNTTASLSLLVTMTTSLLCAQEPPPREGRRGGPPRGGELLKKLDEDGDGQISLAEFSKGKRTAKLEPEVRQKIFERLDKNKDGFISLDELPKGGPPRKWPSFAKSDANGDGRISREEFAQNPPFAKVPAERIDKMFRRLDRNRDGFLDRKDRPRRGGLRDPWVRLKDHDTDKNGRLSFEEFQAVPPPRPLRDQPEDQPPREWKRLRQLFDWLDLDQDGELSPEELRRLRAKRPQPPKK